MRLPPGGRRRYGNRPPRGRPEALVGRRPTEPVLSLCLYQQRRSQHRSSDLTPIPLPRVEDPEVSVVIIAWRLEHALVDAVASIVNQVDAPSYEVIVVFNGAEPAVIERFSADVSGAVAIGLGYNTGY